MNRQKREEKARLAAEKKHKEDRQKMEMYVMNDYTPAGKEHYRWHKRAIWDEKVSKMTDLELVTEFDLRNGPTVLSKGFDPDFVIDVSEDDEEEAERL